MLAEIITIGDEILIGQIVDSNSAWMAVELNKIGINVKQISSISDNEQHILRALKEAEDRADIILITGGLGPTKDDITKQTLCKYFNCGLKVNTEALENVITLFTQRGYPLNELNKKQAELPETCEAIINTQGTASGMWFEKAEKVIVSMPGVPYEMYKMMELSILPKLQKKFKTPVIFHRTILTQGVGESIIAEKIQNWENNLPENLKLAYLPSPGLVRLRISATGNDETELKKLVNTEETKLLDLISDIVYGFDNETLESVIKDLFTQNYFTLSTAESCTGGYIAHLITSVSGSSSFYKGSVISYSNEIKINELQVSEKDLKEHGAVSQQVVEQMAKGIREKYKTTFSIATSGIAGPDGGSDEKPVGTVWIAIASESGVKSNKFLFGKNRERNIRTSSLMALGMLRREVLKKKILVLVFVLFFSL